jgi:flagellar protein FliS
MYRNGTQSYQRTNVMTADPKKLVLMCYDGAIDSLKIGKQRLAEKDYEGKAKALIKAQDIINELLCALDYEKGGSIAKSLDSLYNYMLRRITHADLTRDVKALDEVIGMLGELKSAWQQIFYGREKEVSPQEAGSDDQRAEASGFVSA